MGEFKIYQDNYADFTIVSNRFIDEYMEDANDAQLKVYLYLIRMLNADLATGISDIADRFNYTEKDVIRALHYWEKKKLLFLEYDSAKQLVGVHLLPLEATVVTHPSLKTVPVAAPVSEAPVITKSSPTVLRIAEPQIASQTSNDDQSVEDKEDNPFAKPIYSKDELKQFKERESSEQLIFVAEQYLHKTLTPTELTSLIYISDVLHFSDDLIDYLLQYCVGREKTDHRYIEAVALNWAQSGITTPKQAAAHARKYDKIIYEIMNALGKQTYPSTAEIGFITKWTKEYAYDMSVIEVACERTVLNTDKKRFNYADSILSHWHSIGVRHKADIDSLDPPKQRSAAKARGTDRNKFNQFPQNTYDFEALEKALMRN